MGSKGLDVYIAGDDVGEILAISSIDVTYSYYETVKESIQPTPSPTQGLLDVFFDTISTLDTIDPMEWMSTTAAVQVIIMKEESEETKTEKPNSVPLVVTILLAVIGVLLCSSCIFGCLYFRRVKSEKNVSDDNFIAMVDMAEGNPSEEQLEGAVSENELCVNPQTNSSINTHATNDDDDDGSDDEIYQY